VGRKHHYPQFCDKLFVMFHSTLKVWCSVSALAAGLLCSVPAFAQAPAADQSVTVLAKFDNVIDTKSAKVGDPVAAKVKKDLKTKDLTIPKGSRILGSVTSVQSVQQGNGTSALAIKLDRIEMKGGQTIPIQGLITGIGGESAGSGIGVESEVSHGAFGPTPGQIPQAAPVTKDGTGMADGSDLDGIAIGKGLNPDGANELRGMKRNIKLDQGVTIKVAVTKQ
jgi:hypothetical protein